MLRGRRLSCIAAGEAEGRTINTQLVTLQPGTEDFDLEVIATVGGGATGPAGRGISSITNHNNDNDLQINYSDSTSESVSVPSGPQGRGIVSITQPNRATDPTAAQVNFTDGLNPSNIVLPSAFGDQSVELVNISDRVTDPNNGRAPTR